MSNDGMVISRPGFVALLLGRYQNRFQHQLFKVWK